MFNRIKNILYRYIIYTIVISFLFTSCNYIDKKGNPLYSKYETNFIAGFDTYAIVIGYALSEEEFTSYADIIYKTLERLNKYFDIYNDYEGINNLKTVNDNAGIKPIVVDKELMDFIILAKQAYYDTDGIINIALGSVLKVWHEYRTDGLNDTDNAKLPPFDLLTEKNENTDIEDVIIDEKESTIFLKNPNMSIDVGSLAKGYASQVAADKAKEAGLTSALLNIGGNIVSIGKPLDDVRDRWGVGIQDPKNAIKGVQNIIETVFVNDAAIVNSGNYQRYYMVNGKRYNHIIDPNTLMPAALYDAVAIIHEDSYIADMLSTVIFILPYEKGKVLAEKFDAKVMWVYPDEKVKATDGFVEISKNLGGYSAVDKN